MVPETVEIDPSVYGIVGSASDREYMKMMRTKFPILGKLIYLNNYTHEPDERWVPFESQKEDSVAFREQLKVTSAVEQFVNEFGFHDLAPINNVGKFRRVYLAKHTAAHDYEHVLNIMYHHRSLRTIEISKQLHRGDRFEGCDFPILKVERVFAYYPEGPASHDDISVSPFYGPSFDWLIYYNYPEYSDQLSAAMKGLGEVIAKIKNYGVIPFDSHLGNYCFGSNGVTRIDIESFQWSGMPTELIDHSFFLDGKDEKERERILRKHLLRTLSDHNVLYDTIAYWGVALKRMEDIVKSVRNQNCMNGDKIKVCRDPLRVFEMGVRDIVRGYLSETNLYIVNHTQKTNEDFGLRGARKIAQDIMAENGLW